jgi:manganese transport protein
VNLAASFFITMLTLIAEVAGVALSVQLITDVNYLLFIPLVGFLVWLVVWRVKFESMERAFGLAGLALIAVTVAVVQLEPSWSSLLDQARAPSVPVGEGTPTYFYYAIALFGAAMTPYEVFFFSSGAVEERWTRADLGLNRANVLIGFPLGGLLSLSLMAGSAIVFFPQRVGVDSLAQVGLPTALALGKVGLAFLILGFVACTFGAALETALSCGYTLSQYFGWQWGKFVAPREAARFHLTVIVAVVVAVLVGVTAIDPIKVTEYSIVLSAAALPLTYFPIYVVANDRTYMGDDVNGRLQNALASVYLVILTVVALATIPLMIATKAGA